ncbi:hypothetical protein COY27_02840 [Candidatus Woesearchaeota archaeon CG_4_10_14_0_2_um_filter_33_13]|nr:MAG: hypothetical protein COY27_02840 [Candidatus Woesearchaeota archaeon CG_4_10_14_0_2_um_filter_33_13]
MEGVKAKCKNCGNSVPADQFKLHYSLKMMVCPNCFNGKTTPSTVTNSPNKVAGKIVDEKKVAKPAGWDKEDEYLDKFHRSKVKEVPQFRKIVGTGQVECTCRNCKYTFKYDPFRKRPKSCPYCNEEIPRLNTFSML